MASAAPKKRKQEMEKAKLFDLTGQVALVTGSNRGLGLQAALGLAEAGAHVLVNSRDAASVARAVEQIRQAGGSAEALPFDVSDMEAINKALEGVSQLDILINNAGPRDRRNFFNLDLEGFSNLLGAHLVGPYHLSRLAAQLMLVRGKGGRIINMISVAALRGPNGDPGYAASKAGLAGLTRALAAELGSHGITVNAIAPGAFATETNQQAFEAPGMQDWIAGRTSLGRFARPDEITGAVVFLASPAASYVTGHTLVVDGGMSERI